MGQKDNKKNNQSDNQDWRQKLANFGKDKFNVDINIEEENNSNFIKKVELKTNHIKPIKYDRKAKSPYNFIPLSETVISYKEPDNNDKYYQNKNTGYIELELETITPLYIRDTYSLDEINKKENSENNFINSDFYSPTGKKAIPGSSLRGMVRNLIEIMSFSKFGFSDNNYLYFRAMADKCHSVKDNYMDKMSSKEEGEKSGQYKMSSGLIYKKGFEYYLISVSEKPEKISKEDSKKKIGEAYKVNSFFDVKDSFIVVSGKAPPRRDKEGNMSYQKNDWIINKKPKSDNDIRIPDEDIQSYLDDTNRDKKVPNIIDKLKNSDFVPCFYVKWEDTSNKKRISFGYNPMFRLSYERSVYDHIPEEHKNKDIIDITDSIFGIESKFATRVFFEDLQLKEGQSDILMEEKTPQILSGPKPTTFQHYLTQQSDDIKKLNHYNTSEASIRGNKMYWHKSGNNWEEKDNLKNQKVLTKIKAVKTNKKFVGRIRFENLSNVELGALLQALSLPEGCAHKLGMGKPLGLGSVKITPKLFLSNRKERYSSFFSEIDGLEESEYKNIISDFQNFIKKELNEKSNYWDISRLKELKIMLSFEKGKELEKQGKTRYMKIETNNNEFKDRPVLPLPSDM